MSWGMSRLGLAPGCVLGFCCQLVPTVPANRVFSATSPRFLRTDSAISLVSLFQGITALFEKKLFLTYNLNIVYKTSALSYSS